MDQPFSSRAFGDKWMERDPHSSYTAMTAVPSNAQSHQTRHVGAPHPETMNLTSNYPCMTTTSTDTNGSMLQGSGSYRGGSNFNPPRYHQRREASDRTEIYPTRGYSWMPPDMAMTSYQSGPEQNIARPPTRWACDYCNVATFLSFEAACAHEETCSYRPHPHLQTQPFAQDEPSHAGQQSSMPMLPSEMPQQPHPAYLCHPGGGDNTSIGQYPQPHRSHQHQREREPEQRGMAMALPTDKDILSARQCYVRANMLEIFAASERDVAARHTRGSQKLVVGQVGIRCVFCSHLSPRERVERAVCYPSSISRVYQTVADMQRFHFEHCTKLPDQVRDVYKRLKATRPRGLGSPQTYWIQSAEIMGLVDSNGGIHFKDETNTTIVQDAAV